MEVKLSAQLGNYDRLYIFVVIGLEVKLPYDPVCPSLVCWSVGRSVIFSFNAPIGDLVREQIL